MSDDDAGGSERLRCGEYVGHPDDLREGFREGGDGFCGEPVTHIATGIGNEIAVCDSHVGKMIRRYGEQNVRQLRTDTGREDAP